MANRPPSAAAAAGSALRPAGETALRQAYPAFTAMAGGAVAALASAKLLEKLVFGVSASDRLTLGAVAGMLAIVALLASLVPAYRAARLNPLIALRD